MYAAAIGSWNAADEKCLLAAASHASAELDFASLDEVAHRMEEHATEARCVFVQHDGEIAALVSRLRERASLLTVPVIAVVPHPTEALYRSMFASGADDALVSGDRGGITRRLANLHSCTPRTLGARNQGLALVASGDIGTRRRLGQTLRRAGFDVAYATEAREIIEIARSAGALSLIVATDDFPPLGAEAAIRSARTAARKPTLPAMVVPREPAMDAWSRDLQARGDSSDKLLCFAEDVARREGLDLRASQRMQHATIAAFRQAGILQPTYGLTHNVSRHGLFVRTLDAPKPGSEVWVELRGPGTDEMLHLRGEVVWRREPGAVGATPFGFGMKLTPDACPTRDLTAFANGYEQLLAGTAES